jgi:hypothetical protein
MAVKKTAGAATFKVNSSTISQVATATFNLTQTPIEVTEIDSSYRKMEYGFAEGTVDVEVFFDSAEHAWLAGIVAGTKLTGVELVWASGVSVKGDAVTQSASISVAPNSVVQGNFSFLLANSAITVDTTP